MERDLTTGSVFKTVIYFFSLPYLLSYFLQTLYWYGRFIYSRTVWRCQQYDGGIDRKSDHAYADSYDRGACNGSDGYDRTMYWCERLQESIGDDREYCRRCSWELRSYL